MLKKLWDSSLFWAIANVCMGIWMFFIWKDERKETHVDRGPSDPSDNESGD